MQTIHIVHIIFASQTGLAALLFFKKPRYLGLVFLLLSATCLMVLNVIEELHVFDNPVLITPSFVLLNGPLWFFFIRQLTHRDHRVSLKDLWHLLPAISSAIFFNQWPQTIIAIGTISQLVYIYFAIQCVERYHKECKQQRSDAVNLSVPWVNRVMKLIAAVSLLDLIRLNVQQSLPLLWFEYTYLSLQLMYLLTFIYLIFHAVNQPELFDGLHIRSHKKNFNHVRSISKQDQETLGKIFEIIDTHIKKSDLFLKPRLSVTDIAKELGPSEKDISQSINLSTGVNFCDYINQMRVEKFKAILKKDSHILKTAFDCGFNSKSSFNAVFKRLTGLTPSQFKKRKVD